MTQWTETKPTEEGYYWVCPKLDDNEDLTLRMRLAKVEFQSSKNTWWVLTPGGQNRYLESCNNYLWQRIETPELPAESKGGAA